MKKLLILSLLIMTATAVKSQTYGDEGPTLTPNTMGLIYEDAINENVPGQVNIRRVSYKIEGTFVRIS